SVILTTRYQTAAQLAFHTPGNPAVLYLNPGHRRANQYDLWPWPPLEGRLALYVNEQNTLPPAVLHRFSHCEPWRPLAVARDTLVVRQAFTWLCWNEMLASR